MTDWGLHLLVGTTEWGKKETERTFSFNIQALAKQPCWDEGVKLGQTDTQ